MLESEVKNGTDAEEAPVEVNERKNVALAKHRLSGKTGQDKQYTIGSEG